MDLLLSTTVEPISLKATRDGDCVNPAPTQHPHPGEVVSFHIKSLLELGDIPENKMESSLMYIRVVF